jgi:hypothetical protein
MRILRFLSALLLASVIAIGPNVTVNVEETKHLSTLGDAFLSDLTAE